MQYKRVGRFLNVTIRQKLLFIFFIVLAANGLIGYAVYESNQKRLDAERWLEHSREIISQSEKVLSLVKDIETASRGFVLTNDSAFLEPLIYAEKTSLEYIDQLRLLTQDNPAQQQLVDSLSVYMHKRLVFSQRTIELRSTKGLASAIALIATKQGKEYTDQMRVLTNTLQLKESILLEVRKQTNDRSENGFTRVSLMMFILMAVFTILLLFATYHNLIQGLEKEKRAAELGIANKELAFQSREKENRADELIIANKELVFQNQEKEKRAGELGIANKELVFQNQEKEDRAAELSIANKELVFQNQEKEDRAAELIVANKELLFQNEEKEKRAAELIIVNKELQSFTYISSHDLQEPLRKIQIFSKLIQEREQAALSDKGKDYFNRIQLAANRMQRLISDLLDFSRINTGKRAFEKTDLGGIIEEIKNEFKEIIEEKQACVETGENCEADIIPFQFRQLLQNLIGNALKFSKPERAPHIIIKSKIAAHGMFNDSAAPGEGQLTPEKNYCHISVSDNGIGFEAEYHERIFELFQRLHGQDQYPGTGIGLAIVKKVIENHNGIIRVSSALDKGTRFDIYIPFLHTIS